AVHSRPQSLRSRAPRPHRLLAPAGRCARSLLATDPAEELVQVMHHADWLRHGASRAFLVCRGGREPAAELTRDQMSIQIAPRQELGVAADFHELAVLQDDDRVGVAYCGETMRNHERRAVARHALP